MANGRDCNRAYRLCLANGRPLLVVMMAVAASEIAPAVIDFISLQL